MSRRTPLAPHAVARIRLDPRFRDAERSRIPDPGWRARGACLQHDPELFFPSPTDDPAAALAICGGCDVRGACLAAALDAADGDGVWGATTPEERRGMRQVWVTLTARTPA